MNYTATLWEADGGATTRSKVQVSRTSDRERRRGMTIEEPLLSVVVTSRNDDHGGSLLRRMQTFVNCLVGQCKRHRLSAELVVVEWNPPADRPRLARALRWPADTGPCSVRVVEVPAGLHRRFKHAE